MEQNKTDQAVSTYQKMVDMGGDAGIRGYQSQVDAYRSSQQFDKSLETARKAVAANPKKRELKLMLAGEMADQGKTDEAFAMTRELLTNTPEDRFLWIATAQIDVRQRRFKEAEEALDKAEPLSTKKEDKLYLLFLRGELAERQKHFEQAEQLFRQALELDPSNPMTLNYLGYMLADKGMRLPEALKMIRKAVDQEPWNGAYLDSLGWVYFKMGEYELAEDNLRQAVARNQTDPTVHEHMGDLYEKTGRIRQAAEQWQLSMAEFSKAAPADVEPGDAAKVQKKLDAARMKLANKDTAIGQPKSY
jgi:tetratricopeptide (TPR) repeat protein